MKGQEERHNQVTCKILSKLRKHRKKTGKGVTPHMSPAIASPKHWQGSLQLAAKSLISTGEHAETFLSKNCRDVKRRVQAFSAMLQLYATRSGRFMEKKPHTVKINIEVPQETE